MELRVGDYIIFNNDSTGLICKDDFSGAIYFDLGYFQETYTPDYHDKIIKGFLREFTLNINPDKKILFDVTFKKQISELDETFISNLSNIQIRWNNKKNTFTSKNIKLPSGRILKDIWFDYTLNAGNGRI